MEDEGYVSKTVIVAAALWSAVLGLFAAAWNVAIWLPERWLIAVMLAASACGFGSFACALHARIYVERIIRFIRATSHLRTGGELAQLRAVGQDTRHRS